LYRFPGGFTSPTDDSFEDAALRELDEETGLTVGLAGLRYVGSKRVNDWRYANNPSEKIMTHVYLALYGEGSGCPRADDDVAEVRWFDYDDLNATVNIFKEGADVSVPVSEAETNIVEEHIPLWKMVKAYIDTNFPLKKGKKSRAAADDDDDDKCSPN
jgi:ADP-ribose pyrophosphatase YjhB (NUDIX family)